MAIENLIPLPPFKRWTLENFPFIEEDFDAITNYQLYCKIVEYLKQIADNQNNLDEAMNYVLNYFNNLDVQTEIDKKLDEMAEDGTLEELISAYLTLKSMLCYDTIDELKEATNLVDGSFARTLGYNSINDGGGAIYKITDTASLTDIQVELDNGLYATLIIDNSIKCYDTVNDMKNAVNLVEGNYVKTMGYYEVNDGGGANYKITTTASNDDYQEQIDDNLYATLILDNEINPKQFGCYCDGTHEDNTKFTICMNQAIAKNLPIHIIGTLTLSSAYQLTTANTCLTIYGNGCGGSFSPEYVQGKVSNILLKGSTRFISGVDYTNSTGNYAKLSINMQGLNFYTEEAGEKYIFENIYLNGSIIKNNTSHYIGLIKGTLAVTSVVDSNKFVGLTCFMNRGSVGARELMSDCVICNNYISGLNAGYCFKNLVCGNVRLTNNFIDYFKTIFESANMGGTLLSEGNIYDGYCFIIEGSSSLAQGQMTFLNDRFFTNSKARCIELGQITNEAIKCSFKIDVLNYNIEVINPKIRYQSAEVVCDESFIYGALYSPNGNLKISLINPTYTSNDGSAVANVRLNVNNLINVKLTGSTAAQIFANSGIAYAPVRIDTLTEAPATQRDGSYILPPWYKYFNTTDNKLYQFGPSGSFTEVS